MLSLWLALHCLTVGPCEVNMVPRLRRRGDAAAARRRGGAGVGALREVRVEMADEGDGRLGLGALRTWRLRFIGRPIGSLGCSRDVETFVRARTKTQAQMCAYNSYEHIVGGTDGVAAEVWASTERPEEVRWKP